MLELRPNCELCDRDLPADSKDARICTYECTYCVNCVETILHNVCPTCGGGFEARPIRPRNAWRPERRLGLNYHPASTVRRHSPFTTDDIQAHVARIRDLPPQDR
ncbi:MAG: hypothetical protein RL748_3380 [Pseudomonadota bacterium]